MAGGLTVLFALGCAIWALTVFLPVERTRPLARDLPVTVAPIHGGVAEFERLLAATTPDLPSSDATGRSKTVREKPIRFAMTLGPALPRETGYILELANLRALSFRAWMLAPSTDGPSGAESAIELHAKVHKRGMAILVPPVSTIEGARIIGIADPIRLARVTGSLWADDVYHESSILFDRQGSALFGAFLLMALFSAVLAIINRDLAFFVFSGWLVTTLWTIGSTGGWDLTWLGFRLSAHASNQLIRVGHASEALLTLLLFRALFGSALGGLVTRVFSVLTFACTTLVVSAPFLASTSFLPAFWTLSGLGMLFLATQTIRFMIVSPSPVNCWYAVSWVCFFTGPMAEIALSAGFISTAPGWINMQSGSLAAALLVAVALAERIRVERWRRIGAQKDAIAAAEALSEHYRSMPIGLLRLDPPGSSKRSTPNWRRCSNSMPGSRAPVGFSIRFPTSR